MEKIIFTKIFTIFENKLSKIFPTSNTNNIGCLSLFKQLSYLEYDFQLVLSFQIP